MGLSIMQYRYCDKDVFLVKAYNSSNFYSARFKRLKAGFLFSDAHPHPYVRVLQSESFNSTAKNTSVNKSNLLKINHIT
jgi:hypothetical protein